jgi:hypothetical protein
LTRPTAEQGGAELFFEQTAMLCVYYNAINLIEYSKIRIIDWYKNNGFAQLLKLRPELVTASWVDESKVTNRYGIDPATKIHWLTMLRDYLKDQSHIEQFNHPELLNAFAKFKYDPSGARYNCDITIAAALCEVLDADERELMVQESKDEKKILRGTFFKSVNGRMVSSNNLNTYSNAYTN